MTAGRICLYLMARTHPPIFRFLGAFFLRHRSDQSLFRLTTTIITSLHRRIFEGDDAMAGVLLSLLFYVLFAAGFGTSALLVGILASAVRVLIRIRANQPPNRCSCMPSLPLKAILECPSVVQSNQLPTSWLFWVVGVIPPRCSPCYDVQSLIPPSTHFGHTWSARETILARQKPRNLKAISWRHDPRMVPTTS